MDTARKGPDQTEAGVFDFSGWGELDSPVELEGDWKFEWEDEIETGASRSLETAFVPGFWTKANPDLPRSGRARYSARITGLEPDAYTLNIPLIFVATEVYLDGERVSGRGTVGSTRETTEYEIRSQQIHFEATSGQIDIMIDVAAFHHRDNGLEIAPLIGKRAVMTEWAALRWSRETLYNATLLLIMCLNISVFAVRRDDWPALFLGVASGAFMVPAGIMGFDNLVLLSVPSLDYQTMSFLNSVTLTIAVLAFLAYAHSLYPNETSLWLVGPAYAALIVLGLVHATMIAMGYTYESALVSPYNAYANILTVALVTVIGFRAWWNGRTGAAIFSIGVIGFLAIVSMSTVLYTGWVLENQLPVFAFAALGPMFLLFAQIIVMAERWGTAITDMEKKNIELKRLLDINTSISTEIELEPLLKKIVGVTSQVIAADRSTLFVREPATGNLISVVAQGMGDQRIELKPNEGIAGSCFTQKEPIFVTKAYSDERFNRSVDDATGYRTQSILAVPIVSKNGEAMGVMQSLNREGGAPFHDEDLVRMNAFASQAAIALENANLFEEIVAERNYNDNILRSLRNGVITTDRHGRIVKSNKAAQDILAPEATDLENALVESILKLKNDSLNRDLLKSLATGEHSSLVDVDLVDTPDGTKRSVNLSTSPLLHSANKEKQTLMVLEDISESKRLSGTLRRFMPQEIVAEVLNKDQDALFGSSCNASILFADIRKFTSISETMTARETVDMLNEVFGSLCDAISLTDGVVDKFIGDAIMAVYGVPLPRDNNAQLAVRGGLAILEAMDALNMMRQQSGRAPLRLGVGISTGEVVAGTIGSEKRMDYTVIGDTVNLASRLQSATKTYGVDLIIAGETCDRLGSDFHVRNLDTIVVRGRQAITRLYEVIPPAKLAQPGFADMLTHYEQGRTLFAQGDFNGAAQAFSTATQLCETDKPAAIMLRRAQACAKTPPGSDWNGIWTPQRE